MRYVRQLQHILILLCFVAGSALLAGCDSGGDDGNGDGNGNGNGNGNSTFEVQITGEGIDESFEGTAVWGTGEDPETGEDAFVLVMVAGTGTTSNAVYFYRASDRPGEGTYELVDIQGEVLDGFQAIAFLNNVIFGATGGTLTISSSSSSRVAGSFSFPAINPVNQAEVTVEGTFNATSGVVNVPF
ncbi:MAG TPA: hypothetical protein VF190_09065 [Rhodothermales bacterium]